MAKRAIQTWSIKQGKGNCIKLIDYREYPYLWFITDVCSDAAFSLRLTRFHAQDLRQEVGRLSVTK